LARIGSAGPVQTLPLLGVKRPCDQAQVQARSRRVEADIGPLRRAATLLGLESEQALRLLILLFVFCCDLMAIVLVIAASARRQERGWRDGAG